VWVSHTFEIKAPSFKLYVCSILFIVWIIRATLHSISNKNFLISMGLHVVVLRDKCTQKIFYSFHNSVSLFHYVQHNNNNHHRRHELTKGILQGTKNHTLKKYNLDHRLSFPERYHCLIRRELKFEYNVLESYSINCVVYFTFFHNSLYHTVQKKNKIKL
jgi:hypothetical protein